MFIHNLFGLDTPPSQRLLRSAAFVMAAFGVFLVLVSREHYTIDIVVAYYLVTRMHWTYHTIANIPALQKHSRYVGYITLVWPVLLQEQNRIV